jgi:16S rRNA (uracil1498-N3)-methyltransferase
MSGRRFFVNKISENKAEITGGDYNHAVNVLRLKAGDEVVVFNYEYGEYESAVESIDEKNGRMTVVLGKKIREREGKRSIITSYISLVKKENFEFMLEKLTETGVDVIVPVAANRSVVKVKDEAKKEKRWESIIYSAVKQSGRMTTPALMPVVPGVENIPDAGFGASFFIYEKAHGTYLINEAVKLNPGDDASFIIGPEGGFDDNEAEIIIGKGFKEVSIGDTILRAETAAIASATVLAQALRRSDWKNS